MIRHILSYSGGKDSTAMYLLAMERAEKRPNFRYEVVFADTMNEHEHVYTFLENLPRLTGGPPIQTVRADFSGKFKKRREHIKKNWPDDLAEKALAVFHPTGNAFVDLTMLKGRFPSSRVRFCTEELKINPIAEQVYIKYWKAGDRVINWQGLRREESLARRDLDFFQWIRWGGKKRGYKALAFRPLLDYKLDDIWEVHRRHGIARNPLYDHGFGRVGCFPCIMGQKSEIRIISERFPEHIDRLNEWEKLVSQVSLRGCATFFPAIIDRYVAKKIQVAKGLAEEKWQQERVITGWEEPGDPLAEVNEDGLVPVYDPPKPEPDLSWLNQEEHGIGNVEKWSKTSHGGKQYDLGLTLIDDVNTSCNQWGACE